MAKTRKFRKFTEEPIDDKKVNEVPGVGNVLSKRLHDNGFIRAFQLYGMYLSTAKNDNKFKEWLKNDFHVNPVNADRITKTFSEYAKQHN
uniref:Barrier-to-autointegration factor n=1 Tax=Strongyloides papillosus TaxID=174720 RepID=A0A0N5BU17_STREA